ncbi:uncharacterized protein PV09_09556 [Verruconis gallopava]|uniref:Cytochrome c oxidase polypeptide V n=1 Tax=Verruconis gallopava TaxID=253628 RepID=A0A0D1X976_9PEZI|nr:uncharacterized protein PV09_09556 [Verruconis gallopava]KIV98675.1 hypothetical protein PV09_09556 [Verruconis gallopava]
MMRTAILRAASTSSRQVLAARTSLPAIANCQQTRKAHAISNPTLADIEKRWESMPPQEQADLWMTLRDRMKADWKELTMQEKKAAYWIAFGPHGPRREIPPGEGLRIIRGLVLLLGLSGALFYATRLAAGPPPKTMSKEWQEKTNEFMKKNKMEPITGISSEGYKGPGMIQSPSTGLKFEDAEEDDEE